MSRSAPDEPSQIASQVDDQAFAEPSEATARSNALGERLSARARKERDADVTYAICEQTACHRGWNSHTACLCRLRGPPSAE